MGVVDKLQALLSTEFARTSTKIGIFTHLSLATCYKQTRECQKGGWQDHIPHILPTTMQLLDLQHFPSQVQDIPKCPIVYPYYNQGIQLEVEESIIYYSF
jgi:hypothetical protein